MTPFVATRSAGSGQLSNALGVNPIDVKATLTDEQWETVQHVFIARMSAPLPLEARRAIDISIGWYKATKKDSARTFKKSTLYQFRKLSESLTRARGPIKTLEALLDKHDLWEAVRIGTIQEAEYSSTEVKAEQKCLKNALAALKKLDQKLFDLDIRINHTTSGPKDTAPLLDLIELLNEVLAHYYPNLSIIRTNGGRLGNPVGWHFAQMVFKFADPEVEPRTVDSAIKYWIVQEKKRLKANAAKDTES
jgi:hypothetical protein